MHSPELMVLVPRGCCIYQRGMEAPQAWVLRGQSRKLLARGGWMARGDREGRKVGATLALVLELTQRLLAATPGA